MATKIEWARNADGSKGETWNPVRGCSRVSPGCDHCYAMRQARRMDHPGGAYEGLTLRHEAWLHRVDWSGKVRFIEERLGLPLRWRKPRHVFVNSMSDLFHPKVTDEQIAAVFGVMAACPQHTFQVLTKRAKRMVEWFRWASDGVVLQRISCRTPWPLPNVWLGVTAENQAMADERIPLLLQVPAAVRFVSVEPCLSAVDLSKWLGYSPYHGLHQATRGADLRNGSPRGDVHRQPREDLANRKTRVESLDCNGQDERLRADQGGEETAVRLPDGASHGGRGSLSGAGSPAGVAAHQRPAAARLRDQSQEWPEGGQQAGEPGGSHVVAERSTCSASVASGRRGQSIRETEPSSETDHGTGRGNPSAASNRREAEGHSLGLRHHISDGVKDSARRQSQFWVIAGCESGHGARPADVSWFRSLRDQCVAAGVPFFLKQMMQQKEFTDATGHRHKAKSRLVKMPKLDGRVWDQLPQPNGAPQ